VALAEAGGSFKYDVYTAKKHTRAQGGEREAVGLVDGLACSGNPGMSRTQELGAGKSERESFFPIELGQKGLNIQLEQAQASMQEDRNRILNTIAGRAPADLNKPAEMVSPKYEDLNSLLRTRFAAAVLRPLLLAGKDPTTCLKRLSSGRMQSIDLNFTKVYESQTQAEAIALGLTGAELQKYVQQHHKDDSFDTTTVENIFGSLPLGLEQLNLNAAGLKPWHAPALAKAVAASTSLTEINLNQNQLGDDGAAACPRVAESQSWVEAHQPARGRIAP